MAIVQNTVVTELADKLVTAATDMVTALLVIEEVKAHADSAGINFVSFDALYEGLDSLRHVNGATLNKIIDDVGPQIRALIQTPYTSGNQTLKKRLYDAHRGTN